MARPHIDKVHAALKAYFEEVLHVYKKLITTSTSCHGQVQLIFSGDLHVKEHFIMSLLMCGNKLIKKFAIVSGICQWHIMEDVSSLLEKIFK